MKKNLETQNIMETIEIKAVTWPKTSHGLFDYESKYLDIKKFKINSSQYLLRKGIFKLLI